MLITTLKNNLGKSSHGGQTLYNHVMDCTKIAHTILTAPRFTPVDYPKAKRDQLIFSVFTHDIGKLDARFQVMLTASRDGCPLPHKRVKHEASTLDFEEILKKSEIEICNHLERELDYRFTEKIDMTDVMAFALSHHGLFYLSFEERSSSVLPRVRREWTVFNYGEKQRITLTDLLYDYHPLGGLVILADLLGSFGYEHGLTDLTKTFLQANSLGELITLILANGAVEVVEDSLHAYDPRAAGLRDLLTLLSGGLK